MMAKERGSGRSWKQLLGLAGPYPGKKAAGVQAHGNGVANGGAKGGGALLNGDATGQKKGLTSSGLIKRYVQVALLHSIGSPFGFASLRHIDYPTMILGKSCKLVPVLIMNILLYKRKFKTYKYIVVGMVTLGISLFMLYQPIDPRKSAKGVAQSSMLGLSLLLVNLLIDGTTNSTQDETFAEYSVSGTQMMLFMNIFSTLITSVALVVPIPPVPVLNPTTSQPELWTALAFIQSHPTVLADILLFSFAGAIGQLFIFSTLEQFGSLTLVTITVTRKLFTMLLSVAVFNHRLTLGQWAGVGVVFAGIGVEAWEKRREELKKVVKGKGKAEIKNA